MDSWRITFEELEVLPNGRHGRLPLGELTSPGDHIHGRVEIVVAGRVLPQLGYWGPHDVCVKDWLNELVAAVDELSSGPTATYVYDEGEQGQPAYEFRRAHGQLLVSVLDGTGGGEADPTWDAISTDFDDMVVAVSAFKESLFDLLAAIGPIGSEWADRALQIPPGEH